ncbi:hypothetical protein pb186bvf_016050 [Paramecium bursaria]
MKKQFIEFINILNKEIYLIKLKEKYSIRKSNKNECHTQEL